MTESNHKGKEWCPHCKLQGVKSKMKNLSEKILGCKECGFLESNITNKITTPFTCPRCALEGIKSDLKDYPNHLLTCRNCQWLGKQVGTTIIEALV
jgi:hypothetical protein